MRDLRTLAIESQDDELKMSEEVRSSGEGAESVVSVDGARSLAESFLTQSSTGSESRSECASTDERRLYQRQKQIDYGRVCFLNAKM